MWCSTDHYLSSFRMSPAVFVYPRAATVPLFARQNLSCKLGRYLKLKEVLVLWTKEDVREGFVRRW